MVWISSYYFIKILKGGLESRRVDASRLNGPHGVALALMFWFILYWEIVYRYDNLPKLFTLLYLVLYIGVLLFVENVFF